MDSNLIQSIKEKYKFSSKQINAVLTLLEEKNTVPFIARYRKEQTGGLDEVEIKQINDEYQYMVNLQKRKEEVIHNIEEQGLLTTELKNDILKQTKLQRVEDLYRPYKQKKKTRATEAKRKGLEPFAKWLKNPSLEMTIEEKATQFFNEEIENIELKYLKTLFSMAKLLHKRKRMLRMTKRFFQCIMIIQNQLKKLQIIEH